ncbi:tetratricopeptide repeat protein [Stieleria maiorica]|uniref:tetratricopeptide repeat protein n=1 Tax=Stieleria maiorica TaxID=2795974 RepID=UPI0011C75D22|nr:tetratricopeptide repeat protein [Stieleria maiorica]
MVLYAPLATAAPAEPTLQQAREARDGGRYSEAAELLIQLDGQSDADLSVDFVLLARAAQGQLDSDQLDDLYLKAIQSLAEHAPTPESVNRRLLVRTSAASHFAAGKQDELVATTLLPAFDELNHGASPLPASHLQPLIQLAMRTAWQALTQQRPADAEALYRKLVDHFRQANGDTVDTDRALAMLGLGWATAMQPDRTAEAARRLKQFLDAYPTHPDAASAAGMRITCLQRGDDAGQVELAIADFLSRWPRSRRADELVLETLPSNPPDRTSPLWDILIHWVVRQGQPGQWSAELVGRALLFAGPSLPPPRFDELLKRLAAADETGQRVAVLLHDAVEEGNAGFAEQIAATLISGDLTQASKMARESACRWAGRTGRWSMLALAAESTDLEVEDERRTAHVDRLFAEALTQTGRSLRAARWWAYVVDHHAATDFATLLRCAESAVAHADVAQAVRRLDRVRVALEGAEADAAGIQTALVDLLAADLAVRQVDFATARSLYEKVVRSADATPALRGRAQWMIGETHLMQRQLTEAIENYRKVEGLDPGGPYVAASLVQAGKSFEQLGLTREAGDCYSALLGRFADSSYATEARRRMAVLPGVRRSSGKRSPSGRPPVGSPSDDASFDSPILRR